ncbi:MAG: DNA repair protein RecO [Proteobacteria bacterium]|nr:DNA repair protein RecO [Pseudomonadota bacterium]
MEWSDHGIVLTERRHGESGAIVSLLTAEHGRHVGRVRSAQGPRTRGIFVPGNLVMASWRARLDAHLGTYTAELVTPFAARVLDDPGRLACLAAACALTDLALPEREPHPRAFAALHALMQGALDADWSAAYARWELGFLAELGFGLDLTCCAVTGAPDDLAFVSPRTGRAVSAAAAAPWQGRLLALPRFLIDPAAAAGAADLRAALALTGHFLVAHLFAPQGRAEPAARVRLLERLGRLATISGRGEPA